ncbi:MAG: hypothetical protein ACRDBO_00285, partial [Lachnospiraceae bacterium]
MAYIPVDESPNLDLNMDAITEQTLVHESEMNVRNKQLLNNDKALAYPPFDDSGSVSGITSFSAFLSTVKSRMRIFDFYKNFKAGMQFVVHLGRAANNCTTTSDGLYLDARQGKVLMDLYTQLNSDYVSRTNDNTVGSQLQLTKNNGIAGGSYAGGPVWLRANYQANNGYRAQIGFENMGCNAITLWLDIDGRLRSTNNGNATTTLATTDELPSFTKVTFTSMAAANGVHVTVGSYTITTTGTYLVIMNQYFNYPYKADIDI